MHKEETDRDRVWELIDKIGFCMLSTHDGQDIRARPMSAHVDREDHAVYFLTDISSHKDDEITRNPHVGLAFADATNQRYVSVSGLADVSNDRRKIRELWSTWAKAWWSGPDDPNLRVLKVTPKDAQYWDTPGTLVSYIKMFAAAASDSRPVIGDNAKVKM